MASPTSQQGKILKRLASVWPIDELTERLSENDVLHAICGPRLRNGKVDTREKILEKLVSDLTRAQFPAAKVVERGLISRTLGVGSNAFPGRSMPDLVLEVDGRFHVLEVKSSKVDDNRSQCVLGKPFRAYLESQGHRKPDPREVEQDLIKLELFTAISDRVDTATLLMIDAYRGNGLKWSNVFMDVGSFTEAMRTPAMKFASDRLVRSTSISTISAATLDAHLIVCQVANRQSTDAI